MSRIMIIGASGSGKSTLARALGEKLAVPVVHGDRFYFNAGWVQKPNEEIYPLFRAAAAQEAWIIDGHNGGTMAERAERADAIVYLELGKWTRLRRTLWRSLRYYGRTRPDMADNCKERLNLKFHFDWVLGFDQRQKPKLDWFVDEWRDKKPVVILSNPKAVARFLENPLEGIEAVRPL